MKKIIYSPGEPAGIGPDLIIQLATSKAWENFKIPIIAVGDPNLFIERAKKLKKRLKILELDSIELVKKNKQSLIQVLKVSKCINTSPGNLSKINAQYVLDVLDYSIKQVINNQKTALVTGPLSKETIISINKNFTGHTEYIQKATKSPDVLMMLASNKLKVALATTHIPLKSVPKSITKNLLINKIKILDKDLRSKFNIANPRIKILGLNPHAGENGKIGKEELDHIRPAVIDLRKDKIDVSMPVSADTAFSLNSLKVTDAYLGMYHDQVLPVLKALSFGNSINVTLGVPIIRTSVDHGIALDIAGTNRSDTSSLSLAIKTAKKLIR